MTQKEFADKYGIPLSTLRKWEQGEASPPHYVADLLARTVPMPKDDLIYIKGRNEEDFYYDRASKTIVDAKGNRIAIREDIDGVKENNLGIYVSDLFEEFYRLQEKFNRDCFYDKKEDILWE